MINQFLEDNDIDDITPDDLRTLMRTLIGRKENQRLDFKRLIENGDSANRELARDLCSFANADGGYIVIGADEDDNNNCSRFLSLTEPHKLTQRIRQIALGSIQERIPNLQTKILKTADGDEIILIFIPPSFKKPHMVIKDNKTEFWKRYETDKKTMTITEIRQEFINSIDIGGQGILDNKVNQLIKQASSEIKYQEELAQDSTRINEITDPQVLINSMNQIFEKEADNNRFFRLTITPYKLTQNLVDPDDENLRNLLLNPSSIRPHGFNMETGDFIKINRIGLYSGSLKSILLTRSGHLEFRIPVNEYFCVKDDIAKYPRLNPYTVVEYPVNFLRLAKELYNKLNLQCQFTWQMIYWNLHGSKLGVSHPNDPQFIYPMTPLVPYPEQHFVYRLILDINFEPDRSAFDMIQEFYYTFGHTKKHIPFFNQNGDSLLIE